MPQNTILKAFEAAVGAENVFSDPADLATYAYDAAVFDTVQPSLVVRPIASEALSRVVSLCNENHWPLTVRGAGTNLSGGTIPLPGGVVVLTNGLNRVLEINAEDLYARVQPGVVTTKLAAAAESTRLENLRAVRPGMECGVAALAARLVTTEDVTWLRISMKKMARAFRETGMPIDPAADSFMVPSRRPLGTPFSWGLGRRTRNQLLG